MTFIENEKQEEVEPNFNHSKHEEKEEGFFKKMMIGIFVVLILNIFLFISFSFSSTTESKVPVIKSEISVPIKTATLINKEASNSIEVPEIIENVEDDINSVLDVVKEKNIFQISTDKPEGFYIMVGTFAHYENALKLEKMNPTKFTCHIFDPNDKNLRRVGLFVSEDDDKKAEKVLNKIRKMKEGSWLLYNTKN